ncbi:hypothetical protein Tco_1523637 [Tanacetum coccineum]
MSTSTHPIIVLSNSYIEDAFSSTNTPDYTPASPDYFPASPGNTFSDPSEDLYKDLLASLTISPFHNDLYMKVMQTYNATNNELPIPSLRAPIAPPTILLPSLDESLFEASEHMEDKIEGLVMVESSDSEILTKLETELQKPIVDKCKTGLGYNVVPPPYTGTFTPPKPNLSFSSLEEFVNELIVSEPTVKKPIVETNEAKTSKTKPKVIRKNNGAPIIEDWMSDSEEEDVPQAKIEKKSIKSSFAKIEFVKSKEQVKSPWKTTVKQGNQNRQNTHSPRGNQRNWNNMMSQKLGSNFEMINKLLWCGKF